MISIPTMYLRFVERGEVINPGESPSIARTIRVLQQFWENDPDGRDTVGYLRGEWRDVPLEKA